MRYFVELSYNGSAYHGWQRQTNAPSVQQALEEAFSALLSQHIEVTGCGRTDTGVHAACYVAHFDSTADLVGSGTGNDFVYHANSVLPADIALRRVSRVADDAHARFDATEREYTYYILPFKDPFRVDSAWQYTVPLDVDAMNDAATYLLDYEDFTSFAKLGSDNKTNICHIRSAGWEQRKTGELTFKIRSDRFLRNMVRAIVGTLVDVGRGKITVERFRQIIEAQNLAPSSAGAPARGLFLSDVRYGAPISC